MMTVAQRHTSSFLLVICLLIASTMRVDAVAGRCYLCSQNTLAECAGSVQPGSTLYHAILQYYTEPCNGQCVLFRTESTSTIRGCSWTYGHMTPKANGWHELSPGIRAYFCDSYLCNNGTYDLPEKAMLSAQSEEDEFEPAPSPPPPPVLTPEQILALAGNILPALHPGRFVAVCERLREDGTLDHRLPPLGHVPQPLRQCYSCTAHLKGCDEFLDPSYVSKYIRPCPASCIIFRNPNDHNGACSAVWFFEHVLSFRSLVLTRDCSIAWPSVHAKSGLHKLLGSDAFFCQESL